jgi:hypothetical protein
MVNGAGWYIINIIIQAGQFTYSTILRAIGEHLARGAVAVELYNMAINSKT